MKCVGIDIGSFSVKVAEVEASSNSHALVRFQEYPFSPDLQRDRQLQVIEILRAVASENDPANTKYVIAVPQHLAAGRLREFPFRERAKILKSLPFELEDDIPLDPDETAFDAKIIEYAGSAARAWCVAVPKEAVRDAMQAALEGSIEPDIISVEGLALANLFEPWQQAPPERAANSETDVESGGRSSATGASARAVLAIGHARTLVLVYRDDSLVSARSLLWGGQDVAQSIGAAFSVPYIEALKILEEKSFILMNRAGATSDQVALSKAVSDSVDMLARPLKLALLETRSELNLSYAEIELVGGASQIQNLAPYLTLALEIPCNLGRPLGSLRSLIDDVPQNHASGAVAAGLAVEAVKRARNPAINLRRGEFARQNASAKRLWERWGYAARVAATAFGILLVYAIVRDGIASSLAERAYDALLTVAKNAAGISKPSETSVKKHIAQQEKLIKSRAVLASLDRYNSALDVLAKISQSIPAEVGGRKVEMNVSRLRVDNDQVYIQGTIGSDHARNISSWLQKAAAPGSVKEAAAEGSSPKGAKGAPFAFNFKASRLP